MCLNEGTIFRLVLPRFLSEPFLVISFQKTGWIIWLPNVCRRNKWFMVRDSIRDMVLGPGSIYRSSLFCVNLFCASPQLVSCIFPLKIGEVSNSTSLELPSLVTYDKIGPSCLWAITIGCLWYLLALATI